jgi:hypothetical protein
MTLIDRFTLASLSNRTRGSCERDSRRTFSCKNKTWLNYILAAGSVLGKSCKISQLLPHRNTISSMVDKLYSLHRKRLVDIRASIRSSTIAVNFRTESYTGIRYDGITLHFVHPQVGLTTFVRCCQLYDMPSSNAANIRLCTEQCLHGFSLQLRTSMWCPTMETRCALS